MFGAYLAEFMESRTDEAERYAVEADAPFLMVRSDPFPDLELKVLIFQQQSAAQAFSSGWTRLRTKLSAA